MKIAAICFTDKGEALGKKLAALYEGTFLLDRSAPVKDWAGRQFEEGNALLFIGAAGIAVRAIAPFIKNKLIDSPVLVMDELGQFVIPILSGHVGGANGLARQIAELVGAVPVITTATDLEGKFAVDLYAKENRLIIANKDAIKRVSAKVLSGQKVRMGEDMAVISRAEYEKLPEVDTPLFLIPREYCLGVGCKKDTSPKALADFVSDTLKEQGIALENIAFIGTIDLKKDEPAVRDLEDHLRAPLKIFGSGELEAVPGTFSESEFVRSTVGVGNVCERAACAAAGEGAVLILKKTARDGMTLAIAKRNFHPGDEIYG